MAISSRGSDLDKVGAVLAEKMRSSCVDCHYNWKYWVRLNPYDATRPIDAPRNDAFWGNMITRLLLLPIWLPYWFWERRKERDEMTRFVVAGTGRRPADHELVRQLALEWVGLHPGDFLFGEHDPKVAELQDTFEKILSENT